jgi:hypothetical protein
VRQLDHKILGGRPCWPPIPAGEECIRKGYGARSRNVRFGSQADTCAAKGHVCFAPESGHVQCISRCPLWAKSGHYLGLNEFKAGIGMKEQPRMSRSPASQFAMRASALRFFRINNRGDPPRAIKPDVSIRVITRLIVSMVSPR